MPRESRGDSDPGPILGRFRLSLPCPRCFPLFACRCLFPVRSQPRRVFASEALPSRDGVCRQADCQRTCRADNKFQTHSLPPLVILALGVCLQVVFAFKPLGALDTVVLPKTREVLCILGGLVLSQMARRVNVGAHLVVVPFCQLVSHLHGADTAVSRTYLVRRLVLTLLNAPILHRRLSRAITTIR